MHTPRTGTFRGAILAALCGLAAGCHSPTTVGSVFPRKETAVAMTKRPAAQPQVLLDPGMEVQWEVHTAQDQPGQVNGGQGVVGPDGTMVIGPYGTCKVAGLNMNQATLALEKHLATYLKAPDVRLSTTVPTNSMDLAWRPARNMGPPDFATPSAPGETVVVLAGDTAIRPVTWQPEGDMVVPAVAVVSQEPGEAVMNRKTYSIIPESGGNGETKDQVIPGDPNDVPADLRETRDAAPAKSPRPIERLLSLFRNGRTGGQP